MEEKKADARKLTIQVGPEIEPGVYSNTATVMHSETEVLMDFGVFVPGRNIVRVVSRVIMNPKHAKLLLHALNENVKKYEEKFGEIQVIKPEPGQQMPPPVIH